MEMLKQLCALAREAGEAILEIYRGDFSVENKADASPLTEADRASHAIIAQGLTENFPQIPVLSEEGQAIDFSERSKWGRFWLVDPLDGTKEFIKRNGEFTVNIALVDKGEAVAGVVYAPALDRLYWGARGEGAWVQEGRGEPRPARVRHPEGGLTVVMSRSHPSPELDEWLRDVEVAEAISVGSSLKLCAVAEGRADLYPRLGPTMEWDTAAGHALVEAAGGTVTTLDGLPLTYNKENLLNPFFIVRGG